MKPRDDSAISKEIEKLQRFRLKRSERSVRNISFVPIKATIRLEFIRCGKSNCSKCYQISNYDHGKSYFYHGPYFCAYWRDENNNGKLKKKYIGQFNSELELRLKKTGKRIGQWNPILKLRKNSLGRGLGIASFPVFLPLQA